MREQRWSLALLRHDHAWMVLPKAPECGAVDVGVSQETARSVPR